MIRKLLIGACFLACIACKEEKKIEVPKQEALVQVVTSPAGMNSTLPYLFSDGDNTLLSWVEKVGDSLAILKYAALKEGEWQAPSMITQGTDWFVNWADFPAISENNGTLLSHVLKKSSGATYSYDVKLSLLPNGQSEWQNNLALHTDNTPTEHGFVTALPYGKDGFFLTWLDGRNTEEKEGQERGAMTLRAAEISATGALQDEVLLDGRTCDCCQTTAAITANGPVVLYRDRSEEEVRDIYIVRKVAGEWTEPKAIHHDNWQIKGCPVNGPKAAVLQNNLAVAWFTAEANDPRVHVAFSADGGEHFDAPIRIGNGHTMGRVDVAIMDETTVLVSYMESDQGRAQIKAVKVKRSGELSDAIVIAALENSRKTGFPQMELVGDRVYFSIKSNIFWLYSKYFSSLAGVRI